ncbi:MAG: hypothetical protein U0800_24180 [Isosphaeraceae bacterium]
MNDPAWKRTWLDLALLAVVAAGTAFAVVSSDREFRAVREGGIWMGSTVPPREIWPPRPDRGPSTVARRAAQDATAILYATSLGLALMAYLPGRAARLRRRGPGHVALAITGGFVAYGLVGLIWWSSGPATWTGFVPITTRAGSPIHWHNLIYQLPREYTYAILAGWIYLVAIGGWRRPRDPFERAGRWVGLAWIVSAVAAWALRFLPE